MSVTLLALYIGITLTFGASGARLESAWADPWWRVNAPGAVAFPWAPSGEMTDGLALPGIVWASSSAVLAHEWTHVRQAQHLGYPALLTAYLVTGGAMFEDYRAAERWTPPAWTGRPRCPLLTFTPAGVSLWACRP